MGTKNKISKEFASKIEQIVMEKTKEMLAEMKIECRDIVNKSAKLTTINLHEEATNMYDSLIEQYYRYETKSYYRHNAGIGTGWGDNLYYGKNFYIDSSNDLNIEFSGDQMEKYKNDKYATRDEVLAIVRGGFRGVPGKWIRPWSGSYDGEYFSINDTNINNAFSIFLRNYKHIYEFAIRKNIKTIIKRSKYKYFK